MHKRRIRYTVAYKKGLRPHKCRPQAAPYMMELLWKNYGRVYCYSDTKLSDTDHFVRYRFFKHYRRRGGYIGWNMDKQRFFVSGSRRLRRKRNFNLIDWLKFR